MSWNAENEAYRCMVDTLVRMIIQDKTQDEMQEEISKRAKDLNIESQMAFTGNFNYIISRLWYVNKGD